jgi:hypothetical protein
MGLPGMNERFEERSTSEKLLEEMQWNRGKRGAAIKRESGEHMGMGPRIMCPYLSILCLRRVCNANANLATVAA